MQIKNINLNKVVEYIFYSFIFLLPCQTRWIYHYGQLNGGQWEYGTLSLFGTEILLWSIFLLSLFISSKRRSTKVLDKETPAEHESGAEKEIRFPRWKSDFQTAIILFTAYALIAIFWSLDKNLATYYTLHIIEALILIYLIIKINFNHKKLFYAIFASAFIQAVLGIYQFSIQFVVGNKWFGIASQNPSDLGVSVVGTAWRRWLRAYGSFTHPNILAGFLALGFLAGLYLIINHKVENKKQLYGKLILVLSNLIIFLGLLLTFSRAAWISLFIVMLVCCHFVFRGRNKVAKKNLALFSIYCLLLTILIVLVLKEPFLSRTGVVEQRLESKSTTERLAYYKDSWELIKKNPILGVGAGNYTLAVHDLIDSSRRSSWVYQPVHNVFVLIFVELGAVGFLLFLYLLFKTISIIISHTRILTSNSPHPPCQGGTCTSPPDKGGWGVWRGESKGLTSNLKLESPESDGINLFLFCFLILILTLGLFDHYLWTSYFGVMMSGVVVGIVFHRNAS